MKVVHIYWSLTFGGTETMLVNIANEQAKSGNDVTILLIDDCYEPTLAKAIDDNVKFMNVGRKGNSYNPTFIIRLNAILNKINPDVIHLHACLYSFLLSKRLRRAACFTLHALPHGVVRRRGMLGKIPLWNAINRKGNVALIDKVPKVFAISQAVHDELLERYGVESTVVTNGIVTRRFKQRAVDKSNLPFRIVQVSRLYHDKKGQDILIRAVAMLRDIRLSVDFIGDGKSMEYLMELAKELNVADRVNFLGKRTQDYVSEHLCDYNLFVQPSRFEGFGLTVAEAMAAKVPVLVSSGQGPAEVCCNNQYGWIFENGSVEDLTDKLLYLSEHYAEAITKADMGQRYVSQTYDVSVTARNYIEEYKKL